MNVRYKDELISIIIKHLPHATIYLFGSRARSTHSPGSDIDIAIDAERPISWSTLGEIKEAIEESMVPFFVDIVDVNSVSEDMKKRIMEEGIVWYRSS